MRALCSVSSIVPRQFDKRLARYWFFSVCNYRNSICQMHFVVLLIWQCTLTPCVGSCCRMRAPLVVRLYACLLSSCVHMRACMRVCMCVCLCCCLFVCLSLCVSVCAGICAYVHSRTLTRGRAFDLRRCSHFAIFIGVLVCVHISGAFAFACVGDPWF